MTNTPKGNVLFVDDDKFLADIYGMKFTAAGYGVEAHLSTDEALSALRNGFKPDAIVFDLIMPEHDGFFLLQVLRGERLAEGAALIALTNQSNDSERVKAERLGVDRYVVKASMIPSEVVAVAGEEIEKKRRTTSSAQSALQ